MGIPQEIETKLEYNSSWLVQHEDIVRVMDETSKEKPSSRYMIQQQLENDPSKGTIQDRLDELVELEVLDNYEYQNVTLYDLAFDPIVTDGGSLRDASLVDVATLRDLDSLRDLGTGVLITSFVFFGYGLITEQTSLTADIAMTGNFYMDAGIMLYIFAFVVFILVKFTNMVDRLFSTADESA